MLSLRLFLPAAIAIVLTIAAGIAIVRGAEATSIEVVKAWARATPPGASVGAAYVTVANRGVSDERLVRIETPVAERVEIHETVEHQGVAKMRPLDDPSVPSGSTLEMRPGGVHIMLMGLSAPLVEGTTIPLTLAFSGSGVRTIDVDVAPLGADVPPTHKHPM